MNERSERYADFLRKARVISAALPWLALLGWLASVSWFLTDDAFISFRYVRNLLEGHGLVYNPGEYVEGYSNFLWILELAVIWGLFGVRPEQAAPWLSVAFTAGTIAAMTWWITRLPWLRHRGLVAWMALGIVCSSATFAVWTSGGGLETRQFTFFILLAVVCLSLYRDRAAGLLAASLSLAAASLTRPEGPMIAACCFGWFALQGMVDRGRPGQHRDGLRALFYLTAPCVALVAAHYLFRYAYYGEWLPNTYYAKHVGPWYESGFRYVWAAALETGLYLLIPLALLALRERWRQYRDGTYALALILIGAHLAYVMRIGGDHFEYRPLDFYWPLLALSAAEGIAWAGSRVALVIERFNLAPPRGRILVDGTRTFALILFVPIFFYSGAMQAALLFEGATIRERIWKLHIDLNEENAGWLLAAPGMSALVAISNDLRRQSAAHSVASPFTEHREFANARLRNWKPYENMERGVIPDDALMAGITIGIQFYYVPDLKVIDILGLTDATVARNPVIKPNHRRVIAHDRRPPPGYVEERGVNFSVRRAASSESEALSRAEYALKVGPGLWMPFDSPNQQWVLDRFAWRDSFAKRASMRDYLATLVANSKSVIRSEFDVYLDGKELIYVKRGCNDAAVALRFFVHLTPIDRSDLPEHRKQYKFDNLDFRFEDAGGVREGDVCAVTRELPDYEIAEITTGQYVSGGEQTWRVAFSTGGTPPQPQQIATAAAQHVGTVSEQREVEAGVSIDSLVDRIEALGGPVVSSEFDVYLDRKELIYVKRGCSEEAVTLPFFVHLTPIDRSDLPEHRKQYKFDNLDFRFKDADGIREGDVCAVTRRLPDYEIAEVRTGQYVSGGEQTWKVKFQPGQTPPVRSLLDRIEALDGPIISSEFDVYLDGKELIYVKRQCSEADVTLPFFLHLTPVDTNDLPEGRRQYKFDNLDFSFAKIGGIREGGACVVTRTLPDYDIVEVRTGQYRKVDGGWEHPWKGAFATP